MAAPTTIDQMVQTYTNASLDVKYTNGQVKNFPLSYQKLFKSEDKITMNKGKLIPAGTPIDVNIFILGGTGSVSADTENQLNSFVK